MGNYQYIETPAAWDKALEHCSSMGLLAVDTEFIRRDTYFPKVGLIQLATEQRCFLLDPLAIDDLSGLAGLLTDSNVIKVLHSCSEDLEVFTCALGVVPESLFDTQIGAAYVGLPFSMGYQALVAEVLDLHLEKGETTSNWLQRPLTDLQLEYAAQDVHHLLELYQWIQHKLEALGRSSWLQEDCQSLLTAAKEQQSPDYRRIKTAWKLTPVSLALLVRLVSWRDSEARRRNTPRSWVIKDQLLTQIAAEVPETIAELKEIQGVPAKLADASGAEIAALAAEAKSLNQSELPPPLPRPLNIDQNKQLKQMKLMVKGWARDWQLAPEQLMKGRDYQAVQRWMNGSDEELPRGLIGWRMQQVIQPLVAALKGS